MTTLTVEDPSLSPPGIDEETLEEVPLGTQTARSYTEMIHTYRTNIQKFGFQPRTLLYPSEKPYQDKIAQYCDVLENLIKGGVLKEGESLLDIGCGYGNLLGRLQKLVDTTRGPLGPYEYLGIDMVPEFLEYAQKQYPSEGKPLFEQVALEKYAGDADWGILLGVVNSVPDPDALICQAFKLCKKGLLVDFNDSTKVKQARYTIFNVSDQQQKLETLDAHVKVFNRSEHPWTILLASK